MIPLSSLSSHLTMSRSFSYLLAGVNSFPICVLIAPCPGIPITALCGTISVCLHHNIENLLSSGLLSVIFTYPRPSDVSAKKD